MPDALPPPDAAAPAPRYAPQKPAPRQRIAVVPIPDIRPDKALLETLNQEAVAPSPEHGMATDDYPLRVLMEYINGINTGKDISHIKPDIVRLSTFNEELTHQVNAVLQRFRLANLVECEIDKYRMQRKMHEASRQPQITAEQVMDYFILFSKEAREKDRCLNKPAPSLNAVDVVEKVDSHTAQINRVAALDQRLTNPQDREIVRRALYAISKQIRQEASAVAPPIDVQPAS